MRIFLTGATGYLGAASLDAFQRGGHHVTALVRTREQAARLDARGVSAAVGNLGDPKSYRNVAGGSDAWVHTAFEYSDRGAEVDRIAIDTLIDAAGERKSGCLLYTSGIWVLGHQRTPVDEEAAVNPAAMVAWRPAHERRVLDAAGGSLRTIVVRPGIVYGGSRGIVGDFFKDARNGLMRIVGSGENHWPLLYDRDLGDLYARLVASPSASGVYHATDEGHERVIDVAEAIAGVMAVRPEIRRMPLEEARSKMGPYADALALDQMVRSPRARTLGWTPSLRSVASNTSRLLEEWRRGTETE
jgi:nucleoside-diphosphate-sugar epimerase